MIRSDSIYLEVMWNCKMLLPVQTTSRLIPCTPAPDPVQPTWSPKVVLHPWSKIFRGEAAKKTDHVHERKPAPFSSSRSAVVTIMSKAGGKQAVATIVKLLVPAGSASAQPPVGPALGAKGVKAIDFAKEFNARTSDLEPGLLTPTVVTIQPDRTFSFRTLTPPTSLLLKRAANITTGARKPGAEITGTVSIKHIYEIAKIKMKDVDITEKEVCTDVLTH